ncbi:MAG: ORC1-type DNA replication protein [Candidatus Nanoarchaeia archaeon]|jgi:cell division control protein 6|nr:ORC1-type DNA replication protein [Candidatus Nanoarchaeia archaeon]|tara:strand:+ start:7646 stop:8863 length:1218 start_codon:yes stop_codon:yes gene_type:complete
MRQKELDGFFEKFLEKDPLFINKKALQGNYTPKNLPHREDQINQIAGVLAPALRMEKPSNIFIYGKTGTGKSLCINYIADNLLVTAEKNKIPLKIIYLNCKLKRVADTEYRLIAQLTREFGVDVPATGLPTEEIYKLFVKQLDKEKRLLLIVLDEIDQLVHKTGDEILYNLTRLNTELKNSEVTLIGISNDLLFVDNLDPRVKSSLSEEELVFPPYNAIQLQSILKQRAKLAFRKDVIEEGVIEKCAAYAARDHGDARRALELLRVAGEITERKNENKIIVQHIDGAEDKIERDRVLEQVNTQPKQFKLTLYSIFNVCTNGNSNGNPIFTGDIYEIYKQSCINCGLKPLTQRRVSDIIAELDMLGMINAKVISKGRYGRTREIKLAIPNATIPKINDILKEGLGL